MEAWSFDSRSPEQTREAGRELGRRPDSWLTEPPTTPEVSQLTIDALKELPPLLVE